MAVVSGSITLGGLSGLTWNVVNQAGCPKIWAAMASADWSLISSQVLVYEEVVGPFHGRDGGLLSDDEAKNDVADVGASSSARTTGFSLGHHRPGA